jgi:hypothetical protein
MGAKTVSTTSGGGAATPVANEFQSWLMSQLTGNVNGGGQFQSRMGGGNTHFGGSPISGGGQMNSQQISAAERAGYRFNPDGSFTGGGGQNGAATSGLGVGPNLPSSFNQNGSPFTNAFNNMLNGQVIDPSGANAQIASGIGQGASQFGQNYQNPYTSQQYVQGQTNNLNTNFGQGQTGMADLSGVNQTALSSFNPQAAGSQYTDVLSSLLGRGQQMTGQNGNVGSAAAGQASIGPGIALDAATVFDMNNPYFNALKTQQARALTEATAANNARFGAMGAGAIGSGAQLANSNLQSAASADQTVALQKALEGLQQQDLAERGTRANVGLTSRGQDAQVGIANAGNSTQANIANLQAMVNGQGQNNQLMSSLLQAAGLGRGQDFQNQQFTAGQRQDQSTFNAEQTNNRSLADIRALLENQGLGNTFGVNAQTLNNSAMQNNNLNSLEASRNQNDFNLTNQNQLANQQGNTNVLNSNNYQNNQNRFLEMLGMGQNNNQLANQNQQMALQSLLQALGQSTGIGIEGRNTQTNQQGSALGGVLGAALPIAGQAIGGWMSNRGGGNGGSGGGGNAIRWGG